SRSVTFAPLDNEPRRGSTPRPLHAQTPQDTMEISRPMIIIIAGVIVLTIIEVIIMVIAIQYHDRKIPYYEFKRPTHESQATYQHHRVVPQQQQNPYPSSSITGYVPQHPGGVHDTYVNSQHYSQNGYQQQQSIGMGYSRDDAPIG
ncbi:hypothetical protein PMAYCL1PPCAC_08902, partial [Pristionchus mayeri]